MMNAPNDPPDDQPGEAPEKKIIVDEDWKSRVQAEKEEAERKQEEGADAEEEKKEEAPPSAEESTAESAAADAPMPPPTLEIVATSMGMQAMMSMGMMPHPGESEPKVYLNQAKHFIDTIAMLEEKTEGNRTDEETKLFEELLHQLRMAYVTVQKKEANG